MAAETKKKTSKKKTTAKKVAKKKSNAKVATKKSSAKKSDSEKKPGKQKTVAKKKTATSKVAKQQFDPKKAAPSNLNVTPEERWKMIAIAAYHKAEKRGFATGHDFDDWTEAEKEIDAFLNGS
jgi:hypothetical protein